MNEAIPNDDRIAAASRMFGVLSAETRLRILALLRERDLCVGALACRLGVSQGAVSQHLRILRDAGLVTAERDGYYVHYRVARHALAGWQRAVDELLERLQEERAERDGAEYVPSESCKRRKENACARRKTRANAGKGTT
jgi:DNA-binding transcriptional ArsR family regulator